MSSETLAVRRAARWPAPSRRWSATSRASGPAAPRRPSSSASRRLLRHPDAAQPAGRDQRARAAPDRDPALGPERPRRDREGDPEERHRARSRTSTARSSASTSRRSPRSVARTSSRASTSGWRRPGSRSATSAATRPTTSRRRSATATVGADESHRQLEALQKMTDRFVGEVDRLGGGEGAGGPRGLVAALARSRARPTRRRLAHGRRRGARARRAAPRRVADCPRTTCRATSRSSWTATGAGPALHGLAELEGHAAGVEAIRSLLQHAVRRGVPVLTLYAFSRENWARSDDEVRGLFELLEQAIRSETDELRAAGRPRPAARPARRAARRHPPLDRRGARRRPPAATGCSLNIAFNYAGRTELVDAVRRIVASGRRRRGDRRGDDLATRSTPPACPTPTS